LLVELLGLIVLGKLISLEQCTKGRVVRTPGKPGTPGILLEFHFPTWKTWKTWNFTQILLEFLALTCKKFWGTS